MNGGECLEPETMYSIMAWRFPVWYFISVVLSKSVCISAFGPSSISSNSLVIWFIHSVFSSCFFGCHILVQNRGVSFASGFWYVLLSSPSNCDRIFFDCFGMSYFVCNLITESLTSCLKIRKFFPDLQHSFPVSSLCSVTTKIAVGCLPSFMLSV